jgi:ABC-2 type transport system ATP-binding protein
VLRVEHIRKEFGSVVAVHDVDFTIADGETFGLLGPNGAGKTTTMRMILGILPHDAGVVEWNGERVTGKMRRRFGYLPEERGLYGKMQVREQIAFFGRLHGLDAKTCDARVEQWIDRLEIGQYAARPCSELSKGNQQKVQVACAAVHDPELLILDEPFSGLDPINAEILLSVLRDLKAKGTTLVLSSHQMWRMEELCTRLCIITGGRNRVTGSLAELRAAWPTRTVRVDPPTPAIRRVLASVAGAQEILMANGSIDVEVPAKTDFAQLLRQLVEVDAITRFEALEPSLNDIYLDAINERAA